MGFKIVLVNSKIILLLNINLDIINIAILMTVFPTNLKDH